MSIPLAAVNHWLVFTDLDGTLLDHHSYSADAAMPAIAALQASDVPIIINSSKTLSEIAVIADELGFDTPQIAENGSVIFSPEAQTKQILSEDYSKICAILVQIRQKYCFSFTGFNDWTAAEIANNTGLEIEAAARAGEREASEPLLWEDSKDNLDLFRKLLSEKGLELKRGGRFWHVMGYADKAKAMQILQDQYQQQWQRKPFTIALGDSANDKDMLSAADVAVMVHNPSGTPFALSEDNNAASRRVIKTALAGPEGWKEAISALIAESSKQQE